MRHVLISTATQIQLPLFKTLRYVRYNYVKKEDDDSIGRKKLAIEFEKKTFVINI